MEHIAHYQCQEDVSDEHARNRIETYIERLLTRWGKRPSDIVSRTTLQDGEVIDGLKQFRVSVVVE